IDFSIRPRCLAAFSSLTSTNATSIPLFAETSTIPDPIRPHPITPTFLTSSAFIRTSSVPGLSWASVCGRPGNEQNHPVCFRAHARCHFVRRRPALLRRGGRGRARDRHGSRPDQHLPGLRDLRPVPPGHEGHV